MKLSLFKPGSHPILKANRGSTIVLVIVMTAVLGVVIASALNYGLTETRLNQSDLLHAEARLAAEATVNHGMAQLRRRFDRSRQVTPTELHPARASALQLEPGFLSFMGQSRASVPTSFGRPTSHEAFLSADTIVGGLVVNDGQAVNLRIDPLTPLPELNRPGAPTHGQIREVRVFAKATTVDPAAGRRTAYARQTFQIVDRSLFQNSVFFSGLLEIFPGGNMNLGMGNGPIYGMQVHIGNNVRIHTRIESAGTFIANRYHRNESNHNAFLADFSKFEFDPKNPPDFTKVDYLVSLTVANPGSGALDSNVTRFRELALQAYSGGLLTAAHGIVPQAAAGLEFLRELAVQEEAEAGETYLDSNGNFDQGKFDREGANFGHLLIAPGRGMHDLSNPDLNDDERARLQALNTIEENKFSNRSALVFELGFDEPADDMGVKLGEMMVGSEMKEVWLQMGYQTFKNGEPEFHAGARVSHPINISQTFPHPATRFWELSPFEQASVGADVTGGIYDWRQGNNRNDRASGRIHLLRLDVGGMRKWVEEGWETSAIANLPLPDGTLPGNPTQYRPQFESEWWNGGIYVRMPEQADPGRNDGVIPARSDIAIQLFNGRTIPNRRPLDPDAPAGMTLSTNSALYVQGNFNAPGNTSWDPDKFGLEKGAEAPAALVADAIMLLSDAWDNKNSGKALNQRSPTNTSVSAALVMGNVPSGRGNNEYSGGLENFPRLLENWGGTLTYRGSLIRLFRSESFNAKWPGTGTTYNAPTRNWAFHTGFREMSPPLDMGPRTFRRIFFRELTEAEFKAETAALFEQ